MASGRHKSAGGHTAHDEESNDGIVNAIGSTNEIRYYETGCLLEPANP